MLVNEIRNLETTIVFNNYLTIQQTQINIQQNESIQPAQTKQNITFKKTNQPSLKYEPPSFNTQTYLPNTWINNLQKHVLQTCTDTFLELISLI